METIKIFSICYGVSFIFLSLGMLAMGSGVCTDTPTETPEDYERNREGEFWAYIFSLFLFPLAISFMIVFPLTLLKWGLSL